MGLNADQFTNTNDNYTQVTFIVNDGTLTITPKSINPDDEKTGITVTDPENSIYDGNEHINGLTVTDSKLNTTLVEGTDYTLTYSGDLINVGTVTITVKGIGNYTGEFTKTYQILPREYTVTTNTDSKVYDGTALTAGGTVNNLVDGETVNLTTTGSQTNVGTSDNTYELNWTGTAKEKNYTHGKDSIGTLTVKAKSIVPDGPDTPEEKKTGITVTDPEGSKYDGEEHKNKPKVEDTKTKATLKEGTDYELSYSEDVTNAGTVTVTVTGIGNYEGSFEVTYEITKRHVTLTSADDEKVYDGSALTNDTVTVGGDKFAKKEGATYNVTGNQTEVGSSENTFTYELKSNTTASNYNIEVKFGKLKVTPFTDKVTVTIKGHEDTATYDGNQHSVEGYEVTNISNKLYKENDIGFTGEAKAEGTAAGTYQMNLTAQQFSNISQNFTNVEFVVEDGSLTINPKSINPDGPDTPDEKKTGITVTAPEGSKYDGEEHKNKPTVTDTKTGKVLVEGTDYTLAYSKDVINAGTVTVTVKGIGNYTGEFTKTYQILPREYTVTTNSDSKVYDGNPLTAGGTVNNLVKDETVVFTITGSQTNVGTSDNTYELKFEGTAKAKNYTHGKDSIGTLTVTAKSINPDDEKTGITVTDPKGSKYDGEEHKNKPKVEDTKTKATLKEGTDYELSYSEDVTNAGTVTVTVTGIGNYEGSFEVTYEITKRHVTLTSADDEKVYDGSALTNDTVTVGGDKFAKKEGATYNVTGMQIEKGSSKNTFTYTLNEGTLAGNYDIETFEGTLKVTAFENEVVVTIKGNKDTVTYDGNPHSVEGYVITDISNKLYKAEYIGVKGYARAEGTAAGTYKMNLTAQQFSNTSASFDKVTFKVEDGALTISPKSITPDGPDTPDEKKTGITVTKPSDSKYDGEEHKNKPTVTDTKTNRTLVEGTDYELSYSEDVINAGTVTVTVKGIGNYEGSFEVTYEITKRNVTLTSGSASKVYDKTALTKDEVTVSGDGFAKDEGATYKVTGSRTKVGTSKNTFTYELKSNTTATNYNIEVKFGELKVTAQDGEVVVTITGHSDTVDYDGNEKTVSGYEYRSLKEVSIQQMISHSMELQRLKVLKLVHIQWD